MIPRSNHFWLDADDRWLRQDQAGSLPSRPRPRVRSYTAIDRLRPSRPSPIAQAFATGEDRRRRRALLLKGALIAGA